MRNLFLGLCLLLLIQNSSFSQDKVDFKTYSHAQFFEMVESTPDTVFRLENAIIRYEPSTDSHFGFTSQPGAQRRTFTNQDTLVVNKTIFLTNVHFDHSDRRQSRALHHIRFKRDVILRNSSSVVFIQCDFEGRLNINSVEAMSTAISLLNRNSRTVSLSTSVLESRLKQGISMDMGTTDEETRSQVRIEDSEIWPSNVGRGTRFGGIAISALTVRNNHFHGEGRLIIATDQTDAINISGNNFGKKTVEIRILGTEELNVTVLEDNEFNNPVLLDFDQLTVSSTFAWTQWSERLLSSQGFIDYFRSLPDSLRGNDPFDQEAFINALVPYREKAVIAYEKAYKQEVKLRGKLLDLYKAQHDIEDVNTVYIEIKDLETKRLSYLYSQNPTFNTFFKWKVNQFLKAFSDYGTEPSKAIVFSVNVVFLFAFIYLFFPNSWDEQGKNRILHRFNYYQKYLRSTSGAHEFYLEERQKELSDYEAFKHQIEDGQIELPKFFIAWSKPVYNAAVLGTKLSTRFLKSTDILNGKWKDLSPSQKRWKNLQIGSFLIVGVVFDLSIRVLNALMLSINAFTTLGFGEIPIKGLPRYLAIIQGFIGWFMLTIFSVSLISQLLN